MGFTEGLQERIADLFINVVAETLPDVAGILRSKIDLLKKHGPILDNVTGVESVFQDVSKMDSAMVLVVAEMDAKLVDVQWRARKTAGIAVVNAVAHSRQIRTGDTFNELVERFCRKNLPSSVVQSLLQYAHVWPSLTTHPTNPTSVAYTKVGLQLDRILADNMSTTSRLVIALRAIRDTSMEFDTDPTGHGDQIPRKTPGLEISELLSIANVIYDSVVGPQLCLREALDRFGYGDVSCDTPLLNLNMWGAGDGDGNPNMDYKWLMHQVKALRAGIRDRYVADLQHGSLDLSGESFSACMAQKEYIIAKLLQDRFQTAAELEGDVQSLRGALLQAAPVGSDSITSRATGHLNALLIKCRTFGLRFAGTDVRHNSVDIMIAAASLLVAIKAIPDASAFVALPSVEQTAIMRSVLGDREKRNTVSSMSSDDISKAFGEVGSRVFLRMRVIAAYPDMFQKLIIAETRSAANAVAVLMLLRFAGNKVADEAGAVISIVPLFESREDLFEAPQTFHTLAVDESFAAHIRSVGYFMAMIAKSDTTRLSGPGVQGQQQETVGRLMAVNAESYGGAFAMHIFIGGGDDQMRGGGRIVETPHVLTLAASRLGATRPSRFAMTIQGLQMQLVFGSQLLSEHFIEAFSAQQMLAAARLLQHIGIRPTPAICNRKSADQNAHDFFNDAMDRYEALVGAPVGSAAQVSRRETIVNYYASFPTSIITSANKSSRPMARKKTNDPLQGRAISLDQLAKHDGAYVTATLGVAEALNKLHNSLRTGSPENGREPLDPLRHTYLANKSFRDFVRMQAVVLFQKDYSVCWGFRGGQPELPERMKLAGQFDEAVKQGQPASDRQFLSYLEREDAREAQYLLVAITGKRSAEHHMPLRAPLIAGWPDLASKMLSREKQGSLCQLLLCAAASQLASGAVHHRIAYYSYVGVNPKFSSPSFSLTMTDPQKEGTAKTSEASPAVSGNLVVPLWARSSKL